MTYSANQQCFASYSTAGSVAFNWPTTNVTSAGNISYVWPQSAYVYQDIYQSQGLWNQFTYPITIYGTCSNSICPETEEQKQERLLREAEYQAKVDSASKRAEELLLLHLSDEQRKQYLLSGYFETEVNDKIYRINKGRAMNVELMDGGKAKFKYCALPKDYSPAEDVMLAQLLMLQTNEDMFLKTANRTVL